MPGAVRPPAPSTRLAPTLAEAPAVVEEAPSAPDASPYDLDADRQSRIRSAKEQLAGKVLASIVSDIFVVVGPGDAAARPRYEASVALMRSAMAGYMNGRFGKKPERAISVYLLPNAAGYESFCRARYEAACIAHFGFYEPNDRYMVMNIGLGLGTLTHEIVHPLVEADFPGAPTWLNEGIASVFEQPQIPRAGEIHGGKNWRHPRLARALRTPSEREDARLDRLFGMSDEAFRGDAEDLHYATARYVCQWLDERGKLWAFYQRWRDAAATDPTGARAFEEVVGMTPAEAHVLWSKWTLAL